MIKCYPEVLSSGCPDVDVEDYKHENFFFYF